MLDKDTYWQYTHESKAQNTVQALEYTAATPLIYVISSQKILLMKPW